MIVFDPEFHVGDVVKLAAGPFRGIEAIVTQLLPSKERVKVLMEFLGRDIEAEVSLPEILPAISPRNARLNQRGPN